MHTIKCVRCLKRPAKMWGGHVLMDGKRVIAGWCSERCLDQGGFHGHWSKAMGVSRRLGGKPMAVKKERGR